MLRYVAGYLVVGAAFSAFVRPHNFGADHFINDQARPFLWPIELAGYALNGFKNKPSFVGEVTGEAIP